MKIALPAVKLSWEAEGVRFSAFPPPSVVFELKPIFEKLTGHQPEEVQERPQQGLRNEFGPFLEGHLFVTQQLSRIDFIYGVHPNANAGTSSFASVGDAKRAISAHRELVTKWLDVAPALGRMAYAPVAINLVRSVEEGYAILKSLLPKLPIEDATRNVFWQVNRPRQSKVLKELTVNRLSKWSMVSLQTMQVMSDTRQIISNMASSSHCDRVELDIYTEPFVPIPAESLAPLLAELIAAAEEILSEGDVS